MNAFDIALAVLAGLLALAGLFKGMVRLLIGLVAVIAAFLLAARFHEALAPRLSFLASAETAQRGLAYVAILLGTLLAGAIVAWIARKALVVVGLGLLDRLAGAVLGLVTALVLAAFVALPLVAYSGAGRELLSRSTLAPWVTAVADLASNVLPADSGWRWNQHVEELRARWRGGTP